MHHSTVITLMFLMFGQLLILTFGGFILWLAGDFGEPPKFLNGRHRTDQAGKTPAAVRLEADTQSNANSDGLMALAHDHSIQPQAREERINQLEDQFDHARDRAVRTEKAA